MIVRILLLWIICCHFNNFPFPKGQTESSPVEVEINIKRRFGTTAYIFNYYGFVGTYTVNKGYTIKSVHHGDFIIWRSKNPGETAFHVRVEGIGTSHKSVTIFHSNGEKTKFVKTHKFCGLLRRWEKVMFTPIYTLDDRVPLGQSRDVDDDTDEYKDGDLGEDSFV
ncbi:conserved hypothetical protein [Theileria orientalis strain Shintoku]|uniref:Uncharacterized protein n=1 Tax=Theileria orientalis strain Shintoku TaxID=869250 RepID=J4DQ04_THEOR|nr:conserved hypothetical protein [Theileria orientalis strain Shintoku]BAM41609.1 conserved hypothetical protein [Theileria orientalis strain Shintoku]|eukprot:XP_009691910.1 conserved hypothetical protein [Theileria orientalis strain Shintoku]